MAAGRWSRGDCVVEEIAGDTVAHTLVAGQVADAGKARPSRAGETAIMGSGWASAGPPARARTVKKGRKRFIGWPLPCARALERVNAMALALEQSEVRAHLCGDEVPAFQVMCVFLASSAD